MKHEWRKHEKELYGVGAAPRNVIIKKQKFIMLSGKGNPNEKIFSDGVGALFSLAYAIKMNYKKTASKEALSSEISDYTVYPLEGVWKKPEEEEVLVKDKLEYKIMIHQPDFVTKEIFALAMEQVKVKKPNPFYEAIRFDSMEDGLCVEILHTGSYDEEPVSFEKMDKFIAESGYVRSADWHREIYLNNAVKTEAAKQKTILRYTVSQA